MENSSKGSARAGWLDDPERLGGERYWDGSTWTDHRRSTSRSASASKVHRGPESGSGNATSPAVPGSVLTLWGLLGGGVLIYVIGVLIAVTTWTSLFISANPFAESDAAPSFPFAFFVGALLASLGSAMAIVGLIGFGVKLGREAARI